MRVKADSASSRASAGAGGSISIGTKTPPATDGARQYASGLSPHMVRRLGLMFTSSWMCCFLHVQAARRKVLPQGTHLDAPAPKFLCVTLVMG
eukprot:808498-Amphidinium_carterae.1